MSNVITKFNNFVEGQQKTSFLDLVDMTSLANEFNLITPMQLKMTSSDSVKLIPEVVLYNLVKYAPNSQFPLLGLRAIQSIIGKPALIDDTVLQQILLIHLTKMKADVYFIAIQMAKLDRVTVDIRVDDPDRFENWEEISNGTIQNTHVNVLIDEMIKEKFGQHLDPKVFESKSNSVGVRFFSSDITDLRGFSGFNTVYINQDHFMQKLNKLSPEMILVDIITVTVHELAHVRVRQVFNDLNVSSPILLTGLPANDPEFGRIVERKLFGVAVGWDDSCRVGFVPASYIKDLIAAILENKKLPSVPDEASLTERLHLITFYGGTGADISLGGFNQ